MRDRNSPDGSLPTNVRTKTPDNTTQNSSTSSTSTTPTDKLNDGGLGAATQFDRDIVYDLIDSLQHPPPTITAIYITILTRVSNWLDKSRLRPSEVFKQTGAQASWGESSFPEQTNGTSNNSLKPIRTGNTLDAQDKIVNQANMLRNEIYGIINKVNAFVARAKNAGFAPPENPFALAMQYNIGRIEFESVNVPDDIIAKISSNVNSYIQLLSIDATGAIQLEQRSFNAAQLSSAGFSLDGFGGSGDASVDLCKLLPDADAIKSRKASEALSVFDFTKRIPKVLFTAFYAPAGVPRGVIVGWKKVSDASGYIIKRRNIFDGRDTQYVVSNDDIKNTTAQLREYVNAWILSFYDQVQDTSILSFLDSDVPPHGYFYYTINAYQMQNDSPGSMFAVETVQKILSQSQKAQMRKDIRNLQNGIERRSDDSISPYPILAHYLLGDSKYDWLLAAINVRQSINRNDLRPTTRNYSYLTAKLNFLFDQSDIGRLVVPKDVSVVLKNIEDSISKFGINQVLKELLQETGSLYHFDGKEPNDNAMFKNVDTVNSNDSDLISIVTATVDPENATMDLKLLATNLSSLLSQEYTNTKETLGVSRRSMRPSSAKPTNPTEIIIPSETDNTNATQSEDEIQYFRQLDNLSEDIVDLTTLDGLAKFIRVVRIMSDIGPGRGSPISSQPQVLVPDPIPLSARPPDPFPETSSTHSNTAPPEDLIN